MKTQNGAGWLVVRMCCVALLTGLCAAAGHAAAPPSATLPPGAWRPGAVSSSMPIKAAPAGSVPTAVLTTLGQAPGCQVTVSRNQFDYGRFTRRLLAAQSSGADVGGGELVVGRQTSTVNVTCSQPQRLVFFFRAAAEADGTSYRFGEQGRLRLTLLHAQADGQSIQLGQGEVSAPPTAWAERVALAPGRGVMLQDDRPVTHFSMQMEALATLPTTAAVSAAGRRWNGAGQFELQEH